MPIVFPLCSHMFPPYFHFIPIVFPPYSRYSFRCLHYNHTVSYFTPVKFPLCSDHNSSRSMRTIVSKLLDSYQDRIRSFFGHTLMAGQAARLPAGCSQADWQHHEEGLATLRPPVEGSGGSLDCASSWLCRLSSCHQQVYRSGTQRGAQAAAWPRQRLPHDRGQNLHEFGPIHRVLGATHLTTGSLFSLIESLPVSGFFLPTQWPSII